MEGEKLEIVVSSTAHHCQPDDEWLRLMTIKCGKNQQKSPLIPKVPSKFRQVIQNRDCYDPSVVSIGPYHHWNDGLKEMEGLKFDLACQFVKDSGGRPEEMYEKVKQEAKDARKCYMEDEVTKMFDEEQFSRMMFIDGCFILQFIYYFLHEPEKLMMSNHEASLVTKDLFLLENQLPFVVLMSLWSFSKGERKLELLQKFCKHVRAKPALGRRESFRQKILKLYGKLSKALTSNVSKGLDEQTQPAHLLEFFHTQYVYSGVSDDHPSGEKTPSYWHYPAKEFRNVGISLKPSKTSRFSDVRFEPTLLGGTLYIPQLIIGDCTKPLLLNLVAYEARSDKSKDWVTSYVCSLGSLIDSPEDVKELRSRGLLLSTLGSDQQVADHINEMAKHVVLKPSAFTGVKKAIESHYRNIFRRWILHYKNPISAAIVKYSFLYGFIITAIATFRSKELPFSYAEICGHGNSTLHH
ncbi:hypothetical protein SADUNF_Sadunf16G0037500 [Salix dunnii]|uniref:Uncharacterized protein n=1 Tax=Salix dunnii TaxID=1413687 RepID=A0A835J4W3_9ROSI|nr:hypothetical protein SADUNF_Sadunf16G0037500 [Salix dunnii]